MKFELAIKNYLEFINLKDKPQSVLKIKNRINNHILPYVKNKNIYEFTKNDYLKWQIEINKKNYKYGYKKTLHYCFIALLNHCVDFYDLKENVGIKIGNFRNDEIDNSGNVWSIEEFNNFLEVIENKIENTLFKFMYFTGCRIGEVLALTFNDIDYYNKTISINKTITKEYYNGKKLITRPKTKKSNRIICLDDIMFKEIICLKKEYENFNCNMFIFGGNNSLSITTITRHKNNYCKLSGVKQIKLHEFRHSHACLLFKNSIPIEEISYRLGHSTITMTMNTYLKYIPHNEKRVINTLNSLRLN